jgi:hypothetical protein
MLQYAYIFGRFNGCDFPENTVDVAFVSKQSGSEDLSTA